MVIRNFLFHRVSDDSDNFWPPMKPEVFASIIRKLTKDFTVVLLEDFLNEPKIFSSENRKIVTVLFDDGYKDNIEMAAPILKKYKCPASFYIVTDSIDRNLPPWTYLLDNVLQKTKKEEIELPFDFVPSSFVKLSFKKTGEHIQTVKRLKPWMKGLPNSNRIKIFNSVLDQCNDVELPANKMMSWDDIRQMVTDGFIIGSHSNTHPLLASIENESEIIAELETSASKIKQETGIFPQTISYPIGSLDNRVIRIAKDKGYKYGLAVKQVFFQYGHDNLFQIPRVELYQEAGWKTRLRISGFYNNIKRILN